MADELHDVLDEVAEEQAQEAARRWHSWSNENLYTAGDEHGYDVKNVAQSALPPQRTDEGWEFSYTHPASIYFEDGTAPHEVPGNPTLVFEWENAPMEVQQMFEHSFPTVFLPQTHVDGIDALDYFKRARRDVERWMEGA